MTLETFIENYGYLAILIGTFLEGETVLILGGFAAHNGYLALPGVIAAAFVGGLCGDQLFFFLGRRHSQYFLSRHRSWAARAAKVRRLLKRFETPLILLFRFMYGLRTVAPFVIGMNSVSIAKFMSLNAVGALAWASVVASGGYLFGTALEALIGDVKHMELRVLGVIAVVGAMVWIGYFICRHRKPPVESE